MQSRNAIKFVLREVGIVEGVADIDRRAIEAKVEEIWMSVLNVGEGQEGFTFFELRGESIAAVRLVSRVDEELGVLVDVGDIFEEDPDLTAFTRTVAAKAGASEG